MVVGDQDFPFVLWQHAAAHPQDAVLADPFDRTCSAEGVGAGVGGVGQDVVDRVIGRVDPHHLGGGVDESALVQGQFQALVAQPQPHPAHRSPVAELFEDRVDDAADGFVGVFEDLPVGLAPDQADRQAGAQLAAGGFVADAAAPAGPQDVQFSF
jgi:hypothetical protein